MTEKTDSPKNRADFVFNGYDRIIERLEEDVKAKNKIIKERDSYILELEAELRDRFAKS